MTNLEIMILLENIQKTTDCSAELQYQIDTAIKEIKAAEAAKENKACGNKGIIDATKKIIKWAGKANYAGIMRFDEKIYTTDGHQIIEFPESVNTEGIKVSEKPLNDIIKFFDGIDKLNVSIPLPDATELKAYITETKMINKEHGKNDKINRPYILPCMIGVTPEYLLNAIQATGATVALSDGNWKHPIYFIGENVRYLLLPVNINAKRSAA